MKHRRRFSVELKRQVVEELLSGVSTPARRKCRFPEHRYNGLYGSSADGHCASQFPEGDHSPLRPGRSVCLPRLRGDDAETWLPDQHVSKLPHK